MSQSRSQWSEYKNAEGRVYWSHATTKQSVWEKPDELKTSFEKALANTQWKQYTSKDRPYYVNTATKETKWDLPPELVELKKRAEEEDAKRAARERRKEQGIESPSPSPMRESRSPTPDDIRELRGAAANALALYKPKVATPSSAHTPVKSQQDDLPVIRMPPNGFATREESEEGFIYLLKREGVNETWTWDQTMRKIVLDPLYNALDTLAEKKAAFEKFTNGILAERRAAKEVRITRFRPIFLKMFAKSSHIKLYSTLKTADRVFAKDRYWQEAFPEERRLILEEYTEKLRRNHEIHERDLRQHNIETLTSLLPTLQVTLSTRWRAAHDQIISSPEFSQDKKLQKIEVIDMIKVYEDFTHQLEREHKEESRKLKTEITRNARKAREGFKALLKELEDKGDLTRTSKFKDSYQIFKSDPRYVTLLGLPGSSPLDLWMDAVDDISEEVDRASDKITLALNKVGKKITVDTSLEELEEWCKEVHLDSQITARLRKEVHQFIISRLKQAAEEEYRRNERRRRHRIDDLRYALRKVKEIDADMTYDQAIPHIKHLTEYKEIEDEADKISAWEKYVRRQKEKAAEAEPSSKFHRDRDRGGERDERREKRRDEDMVVDDDLNRSERHREREDGGYRTSRRDDRSRKDDRGDRERERHRGSEYTYGRGERDRERERERDRGERQEKDRDGRSDRDRAREKEREKDDRESKRRRLSSTSVSASVSGSAAVVGPKKGKKTNADGDEEMEEGEI